jgi:hypothetical protein
MKKILISVLLLCLTWLAFPQLSDSGADVSEVMVSYDYSHEELGTLIETSENGYMLKVKLFRHPDENVNLSVKIWETAGNNYILNAGPFTWNITAGPQGWLEYEFPYPIALFTGRTYIISFENNPVNASSDGKTNVSSTIDNNSKINQSALNEDPRASKPTSWFINTSGRIKAYVILNVKYDAGKIGSEQTICYNTRPATLVQVLPPTGGNGAYIFQWQSSSDNLNWTNIQGAIAQSYSPPALTKNTWYRRHITSGTFGGLDSNPVLVTVYGLFTPGSAGSAQTICYNTVPAALSQITAPSGGSGSYAYQWQSSQDNVTWTNISNASLSSYTPVSLTATTWFRRNVTSGNCGTLNGTAVKITVNAALSAGSTGSSQTICFNTVPAPLTQIAAASGGIGNYSYQWQRSADNTTWSNISGATLTTYSPTALTSNTWFRRNVTSGGCMITGNAVPITVNSALIAGTVGSEQTICYNTIPAALNQLTSPSGGTGTYEYQWQSSNNNSSWTNITGATLSSYTPPSLTSSFWYRRNVTSGNCGTVSTPAIRITVSTEMTPGTIGSNQTICYNNAPSTLNQITVPTGGSGSYTYQWQSSSDNSTWNNISGATSSSYSPPALTINTWYRRNVTGGSCGTGTSNTVLITVSPVLSAGTIGTEQTICYGTAPTTLTQLTTPSGGSGSYAFQWQRSSNNTVWTDISGAGQSSYSPGALTAATYFRRNVTSGGCSAVTNSVLITVYQDISAGEIGSAQTICYNTIPGTLTQVTAPEGGTGTYTYQWQSSPNNSTWTNIPGATLTSFSPPALASSTWYRRNVTSGSCGTESSAAIRITVNADLTAGTIGSDQAICYNEVPSLLTQLTAPSGGSGTYTYQWQNSTNNSTWNSISGATASSYSPPALTSNTWYRRNVTGGECGTVSSNVVQINVNPTLYAGTIGTDQTICYNSTPASLTQLTAPSGGSGTYTYQWQRSNDNSTWTNITGATLAAYSPSALTTGTWYRRTVISGNCSAITNPVHITVLGVLNPGTIGAAQTICYNTAPVTLNQVTTPSGGSGVYSYQWQVSPNNTTWTNVAGATLTSYSPPALTSTTWYRLYVTDASCGSSASAAVQITVSTLLTAGTIGSEQSICYNDIPSTLTQTSSPSGGMGTYTYQWQSSADNSVWSNIQGATLSSYSPSALTLSTYYRCIVTSGSCGTANTNTVLVTVNPSLSPGTIGADQTICYNTAPSTLTQLTAPSGGSGSYTYQWQNSYDNLTWTNISGATLSSYSPPALTESTRYRRNVTSGDCSSVSNSVLIATRSEVSLAQLHDSRRINNNTSTTFYIDINGGTSPFTINYSVNGTPQSTINNYISGTSITTGILSTGTYTYTLTSVTDAHGCNAQSLGTSITITVLSGQVVSSNTALVLVNSSSSYYDDYLYYIKPYLDNFGIPYDVCNVSSSSLPALTDYAVLIFGHRNVYNSGYPISQLESAVSAGVGLYSFDPHLFDYSSGFNTLISGRSVSSSQIIVSNYSHFITSYHVPDSYNSTNNIINLLSSWYVTQNSNLEGGTDLVTISSGGTTVDLLQAATYGTGKVVKWCGYDWMFETYLGPVFGMDDLIWKGIVWAARKPFAIQGLPNFVTMRVDDSDGSGGGSIENFEWIKICNEFGVIPWAGTFNNQIPTSYISTLRSLLNNNLATASPHAFGGDDFIFFNHNNLSSFDPAANTTAAWNFYINNGLKVSKYFVPHYYEVSYSALPVIRAMGGEFLGIHMLPDQLYYTGSAPYTMWINCGPYRINRNGYATPGTYPVYYGGNVTLNGISFFNCLTEIRDDGGYEWYPDTDISSTVARGVRHLRRALNSMVLANLFTHEHFFQPISTGDLREIMRQITTAISAYNPEYTSMDYAATYIRARNNIRITGVSDKVTSVDISYSGSNDLNTRCYLFTGSGSTLSYQLVTLPQTSSSNTVTVTF